MLEVSLRKPPLSMTRQPVWDIRARRASGTRFSHSGSRDILLICVQKSIEDAFQKRRVRPAPRSPLQKVTSSTYDVNGRPASKTDRNGTALAYAYTPTGKLASITYPDSSQTTNTYDSLDRLTQLNDSIGTSSFGYDAAGRVTSFTDADGFTLAYTYDAAGNITQVTYPDTTTVTYAYDAANRLTTVTDWLNEQATYSYDQDGRLSSFTQFNGIVTTYTYDAASRLAGMGSAAASYQFTLDGDGNRINSLENQPLAPAYSPGSTTYGYNTQQDRLLSAGPLSYSYDNEGQLVNSGGTCLTFDYNHRLTQVGSDTQFSYDGRGHRLSAKRSGVTTTYIYDPWGNLISDTDSTGIIHKYIYGNGLLSVATSTGRYCYHFNGTGSTVAITDMNQNIINSYAYDPFGTVLNQQETVPQPFKYVGQYGVMAEPNGLYYMRARYYDPNVGRFISEDPMGFGGGDVNLFAYVNSVGKPPVGANLYPYVGALGTPRMGTNSHPYADSVGGPPSGTNLYVYAANNPVKYIDPLGLKECCDYCYVICGCDGYICGCTKFECGMTFLGFYQIPPLSPYTLRYFRCDDFNSLQHPGT
jgi:RHS repeat-associated protein